MKLFISWSGPTSQQIAIALRSWLPDVIRTAEPYVSSWDIGKGRRWPNELGENLEAVNYGIICLTPDNLKSPWIHFEAGALSKFLSDSLVAPLLIGLKKPEVTWPLAQFQMTEFNKDEMFRMVSSIESISPDPLNDGRLLKLFEKFWPDIAESIERITYSIDYSEHIPSLRSDRDLLEELVLLAREQMRGKEHSEKYDDLYNYNLTILRSIDGNSLNIIDNMVIESANRIGDIYDNASSIDQRRIQDLLARVAAKELVAHYYNEDRVGTRGPRQSAGGTIPESNLQGRSGVVHDQAPEDVHSSLESP